MPDTIETPLGHVSKKTAIIGGGAAVVGLALLYRYEKQKQAAAAATAGSSTIDPATGYAYGSAEDAAALANQAAYINPIGGVAGGGGLVSNTPGTGLPQGFGSNAAWSQYVLQYFQNNGLTADNGVALSAALGVYLAGGVPTADQDSLITQAIAIAGSPPIAGPNGYPPYINTGSLVVTQGPNPPQPTPPPPTPTSTDWTTHTTVHEGEHLDQLLSSFSMSQSDFEAHNPGISAYYHWYIPGHGYVSGPGNGAIIALNVVSDRVVLVKSGGW